MKLGSKKHLQNPKLHSGKSSGLSGGSSQRGGLVNPKDFVPKIVGSKLKNKKK
ncbi:MAG: hypothetical protein WCJ60_02715 [bacterium]